MKKIILLNCLVLSVLFGCGGNEYVVRGSGKALGVDGKITLEGLEGKTRMVRAELRHLPPANRLGSYSHYVMWFIQSGKAPVRASQLEYDEGERTAKARATTVEDNFEVRVTAESDEDALAPSDLTIVRQSVGR